MTEPVHPKLLKIVQERDALKAQLRVERIRAASLKRRVQQLTARTSDAAPKPGQRPSPC